MSGLSERNRQIVRMAKAGRRPGEIVALLTPPPALHTVYNVLWKARRAGDAIPSFPRRADDVRMRNLRLPAAVVARLDDAARARRTTAADLAAQILAHVVDDGLVAAVLDEPGPGPGQAGVR